MKQSGLKIMWSTLLRLSTISNNQFNKQESNENWLNSTSVTGFAALLAAGTLMHKAYNYLTQNQETSIAKEPKEPKEKKLPEIADNLALKIEDHNHSLKAPVTIHNRQKHSNIELKPKKEHKPKSKQESHFIDDSKGRSITPGFKGEKVKVSTRNRFEILDSSPKNLPNTAVKKLKNRRLQEKVDENSIAFL